jgi:hypothetical protein
VRWCKILHLTMIPSSRKTYPCQNLSVERMKCWANEKSSVAMRLKYISIFVAAFLVFSSVFLNVTDTLIKKEKSVPLEERTLKTSKYFLKPLYVSLERSTWTEITMSFHHTSLSYWDIRNGYRYCQASVCSRRQRYNKDQAIWRFKYTFKCQNKSVEFDWSS